MHAMMSTSNDKMKAVAETLNEIPRTHLALCAFLSGSLLTLATTALHRRYFHRLKTGDWITPDVFAKRRWIRGVVTK
jgi:hypothetical protein